MHGDRSLAEVQTYSWCAQRQRDPTTIDTTRVYKQYYSSIYCTASAVCASMRVLQHSKAAAAAVWNYPSIYLKRPFQERTAPALCSSAPQASSFTIIIQASSEKNVKYRNARTTTGTFISFRRTPAELDENTMKSHKVRVLLCMYVCGWALLLLSMYVCSGDGSSHVARDCFTLYTNERSLVLRPPRLLCWCFFIVLFHLRSKSQARR